MYLSELIVLFSILYLLLSLFTVLLERKLLAYTQRRLGPSIVGRNGSLQLIWDLGKLINKNIFIIPNLVSYNIHFFITVLYILQLFICINFISSVNLLPFNNIDSIILYQFIITTISQILIIILSMISQSRYALLSAIRGCVQIISFDIFLIIIISLIFILTQATNYYDFINMQNKLLFFILLNLIAICFLIFLLFEAKRTPFDHLETEAEVIAGYATEYSGIILLILYLIEYLHIIIASFIFNMFFCGGWFYYDLIYLINVYFYSI